jgi:hypothetical protein
LEIRSGALKAETLFSPKRPLSPPQKKLIAPGVKPLLACSLKKKMKYQNKISGKEYVLFKI